MRIQTLHALCQVAGLSVLISISCSEKNNRSNDPDRVFGSTYDSANLIEKPQGNDLPPLRFPMDQLIIQAEPGIEHAYLIEMIDEPPDMAIIGQVPHLRMYQVWVDAHDLVELDQYKEQLLSHATIQRVSYNFLGRPRGQPVGRCPVEPDVSLSELPEDKAPFDQTYYFAALEIIEALRDMLNMETVTIGIKENGYSMDFDEFDDIAIRNVSQPGEDGQPLPLDPQDGHGTSVAGIICADNDGYGPNGMASTLLGDRLRVAMAKPLDETAFSGIVAMTYLLDEGHANIMNTSWGYGGPFEDQAEASSIVEMFEDLMNACPDVLFVNAAPNNWIELTGDNDAPAGIVLPNSMTVSSWALDRPNMLATDRGFGAVVDISAPEEMPVVGYTEGGTSYSTAMVTSAAALLRSLGVRNPSEIKERLLSATFREDATTEPGGGVQLSFSHPLVDLLWERYGSRSWAQYAFDWDADDEHDRPSQIAAAFCDEANVSTTAFGDFEVDPEGYCTFFDTAFLLTPEGQSWTMALGGTGIGSATLITVSISANLSETFSLDALYGVDESVTISVEICHDSDQDCACDRDGDDDFRFVGPIEGGWFEFTHCSVRERIGGAPKYLLMDAAFGGPINGTLVTYPSGSIAVTDYSITIFGWLRGLNAIPIPPLATYDEQVEYACEGEPSGTD